MIRGTVNDRLEAIVRLPLRGDAGTELDLDFIVDTGFTSALKLPASAILDLGLVRKAKSSANLADGSRRTFDVYGVAIDWDGTSKTVLAYAIGDVPMIGMKLLAGFRMNVDVEPLGEVEIVP